AQKLEADSAGAEAESKTAKNAAAEADARRKNTETQLAKPETTLRAKIGVEVSSERGTTIEERVLAAFQSSEAARRVYESFQARLHDLDKALGTVRTTEALARKNVEIASITLSDAEARLTDARAEASDLEARIRTVTPATDPAAER